MVTSPGIRALMAPGWVRDPLWTRAQRVPSLDLRFAANRSLRDHVSGAELVTFTRASSATVIGPTGLIETVTDNVPRFQHDPTTGQCLGLLVEEQRVNLLLRSEEFDSASWTKITASISANAGASPSGGSTADKLIVDNGQSAGYAVQATSFTSGTTYTVSCYAKAGEVSDFRFVFESGAFGSNLNAVFNLSTGVVSSFTAGSASIQSVGNGWYRCIATAAATITASASVQFRSVYAGNGVNGILIWGAQLEAGSFPTSYIPTTGTSATRSADVATISSGLSVPSLRALYAQFISPASGTRGIVSLNDNTSNQRIALNTSGTDPLALVVDGGVTQASIDAGTVTANVQGRLAARFSANDFAASFNGGAEVLDTAGTLPVIDRMFIGRSQAGEYLNGTIARLTGWDRRLELTGIGRG